MVLNHLVLLEVDLFMPSLSNDIQLKMPSLSELNSLSMPSVGTAVGLDVSPSTELREIAKGASSEELSFYKFQVDRHADRVGLSESYIQGSLPAPQALLRAA